MNLPNIFFGIAADFPVSHKTQEFEETLLGLIEKLSCSNIVINNQVHGASGITIEKKPKQPVTLRADDGDYLITAQPGVAIGVMTADCLPVVFYAPDKHVIAVAHAGWRGSVAGISTVVIDQLVATFSIDTAQLKVWFGPAGKNCCYEVQADFASPWPELMHKRNGKYFFDNIALNYKQLLCAGVLAENIDLTNNHCTICNHSYHSYRRAEDKAIYNCQVTAVCL